MELLVQNMQVRLFRMELNLSVLYGFLSRVPYQSQVWGAVCWYLRWYFMFMRWEKRREIVREISQRWVTFRGPFCLFFVSWPVGLREDWTKMSRILNIIFSFWSLWIKRLGSREHFNNSIHQGVSLRRFICQGVGSMGNLVFVFLFFLRNCGC